MSSSYQFKWEKWHCPICGPGEEKFLGYRGGKYHRNNLGLTSTMVACKACDLIYSNPFPVPQNLAELYSNPEDYFSGYASEEKVAACKNALTIAKKFVPHLETAKLLDIGAGCGELVYAAQSMGLQMDGLEFSKPMIEQAKNKFQVILHQESAENWALKNKANYDLVYLNAVLEHLHQPQKMIEAVRILLKPNGILFIEVPKEPYLHIRLLHLWEKLKGSERVFYLSPTWPPFHVYGFNHKSIKTLLKKYDFEILETKSYSSMNLPNITGWKKHFVLAAFKLVTWITNLLGDAPNLTVWAKLK